MGTDPSLRGPAVAVWRSGPGARAALAAPVLMAASIALCACGGEPVAARLAVAPVPPPFRPQSVEVVPHRSDSGVTLTTAAAYKPVEPVLSPGPAGSLARTQDRTGRSEDRAAAGRDAVRGDAGTAFRLVWAAWGARFQSKLVEVVLGASGSSVTLTTTAEGGYALDGQPFAGGEILAANGNRYRLALVEGAWVAEFIPPEPAVVALGALGPLLEVRRAEDGSYRLGETILTAGLEYEDAASGNTYVFTQGPDGTWTAAYKPVEQTVRLGPAGSLALVRAEDGAWFRLSGGGPVAAGDVVTAANGASYRLALSGSRWSAMFEPERIPIIGTDLVAMSIETGDGYRIGPGAVLPANGVGDVTVEGASYHVWPEDGGLHGARFDFVPYGTDAAGANFQIGLASGRAVLSEDDRATRASEDRTTIRVGGAEFPLGELLGTGEGRVRGREIVREARELVKKLRRDAEVLIGILDNDSEAIRRMLERSWDAVQTALDGIFGAERVAASRELRPDRALRALDRLAEALSSVSAFRAATAEHGPGVFREAALTAAEAAEAFGAAEWEAMARMGVTQDTRYGAVWKRARPDGLAITDLSLDRAEAAGAEHGAFAYSTAGDTHQSWQVPHDGTARYKGGTAAVSGRGTLYTGEIELLVRFRTQTVSGRISNLRDGRGRRWAYLGTESAIDQRLVDRESVDWIGLPDMRLETKADWARAKREPAEATIFFLPGGLPPERVPATFAGHLVGRGREAGSQAVGVWSVGEDRLDSTWMAGGFGADRVASQPESQPESALGVSVRTTVVPQGGGGEPLAEIRDGVLELRGTQYGADLATDDPDDERAVFRSGARVAQAHLLGLHQLFATPGSEHIHDGRRYVEMTRTEIERLRGALVRSFPLFDRTDFSFRELIWERIDAQIEYWLFGFRWLGEYPTRRGRADDAKALETIDRLLVALESPAALAEALRDYGEGIFVGPGGRPIRETDSRQAWDRVESRIRLWTGSTRYTRFGAWRKQTAVNAVAEYVDRLELDENGPDAFAYSSLSQTAYMGDGDPQFPLGASATYSGETIAVQGTTFYTGTAQLRVSWHDAWQGVEAGRLWAAISGLRDDHGDRLTFAESASAPRRLVDRVAIANVAILVDNGAVGFADDSASVAMIRFADRAAPATPQAASIEGKFVGKSADGPLAAIGLWTVDDGSRLGKGGRMRGAFGAELEP